MPSTATVTARINTGSTPGTISTPYVSRRRNHCLETSATLPRPDLRLLAPRLDDLEGRACWHADAPGALTPALEADEAGSTLPLPRIRAEWERLRAFTGWLDQHVGATEIDAAFSIH